MSSIKLVLLGFLRHTIGVIGALLVAKGYLSADVEASWVGKAVEESFGGIMVLGAYAWSAIDKQQVIGWIKKALHMEPPATTAVTATQAIAEEKVTAAAITPLITPVAAGAKP